MEKPGSSYPMCRFSMQIYYGPLRIPLVIRASYSSGSRLVPYCGMISLLGVEPEAFKSIICPRSSEMFLRFARIPSRCDESEGNESETAS